MIVPEGMGFDESEKQAQPQSLVSLSPASGMMPQQLSTRDASDTYGKNYQDIQPSWKVGKARHGGLKAKNQESRIEIQPNSENVKVIGPMATSDDQDEQEIDFTPVSTEQYSRKKHGLFVAKTKAIKDSFTMMPDIRPEGAEELPSEDEMTIGGFSGGVPVNPLRRTFFPGGSGLDDFGAGIIRIPKDADFDLVDKMYNLGDAASDAALLDAQAAALEAAGQPGPAAAMRLQAAALRASAGPSSSSFTTPTVDQITSAAQKVKDITQVQTIIDSITGKKTQIPLPPKAAAETDAAGLSTMEIAMIAVAGVIMIGGLAFFLLRR